jgi:hypothetical protein
VILWRASTRLVGLCHASSNAAPVVYPTASSITIMFATARRDSGQNEQAIGMVARARGACSLSVLELRQDA